MVTTKQPEAGIISMILFAIGLLIIIVLPVIFINLPSTQRYLQFNECITTTYSGTCYVQAYGKGN